MKLRDSLDKTISDFCQNKFTDSSENHCAHYVCHMLEVSNGYTCKMYKNGSHPGACLRVQELFAVCPQVGDWVSLPQEPSLVFVTDRANVDIVNHRMRNVPKKHVGIISDGYIYHYSNTDDIVVRQTPDEFLNRFQNAYGGNQALFFGTFPQRVKTPDLKSPIANQLASSVSEPLIRRVSTSGNKTDYYATLPEVDEYYIARETTYKSYRGLFQPSGKLYGPQYEISKFFDEYETVAGMLGVIAAGESGGYFNRLNSYDRAAFTLGFFQFAAHTPGDNLILLFRRLASENTMFKALFPDLVTVNGILHQIVGEHSVSLEKEHLRPGHQNEKILKDFMSYLNVDGTNVDEIELSAAARLVYLANTNEDANKLQVNLAAEITMRKLRNAYSVWYKLDGISDLICTAIADIHHQGRGTKSEVRAALANGNTVEDKLNLLCKIGEANYGPRCDTLKKALSQAKKNGWLGISVFDKASGLFRPTNGWPA